MRRMGWRDGQGVGPRITLEQRKKMAREIGVKLDDEEGLEGGRDETDEARKHYYAPLDRPLSILEEGNVGGNGWGLGYVAEKSIAGMERGALGSEGVGLRLEEEEEEDDVYGGSSKGLAMLASSSKRNLRVVDLERDDYGGRDRVSKTGARGSKEKVGRCSGWDFFNLSGVLMTLSFQ